MRTNDDEDRSIAFLHQVEQWILDSNRPGPQQYTAMQALLQSNHTLQLWWELLRKPQQHEIVLFYALNQIVAEQRNQRNNHEQQQQPPPHDATLQVALREFVLNDPNGITVSSTILRNKAASILATLMIYDGGTARWPSMGNDLLRLFHTNEPLALQTIILLMEDFHIISTAADNSSVYDDARSATHATASVQDTRRLKDYLKGYTDDNHTIPLLQQLFQRILTVPPSARSITAIGMLFRWTIIPNDATAVQGLLESIQANALVPESLQALSHWCETIVLTDDTISQERQSLLERLVMVVQSSNVLLATNDAPTSKIPAADDAETVQLVIRMAQICNTIGLRLERNIPLFFSCWRYDDIDVTLQVVPMARQMTARMNEELYERFLTILFEQIQYPMDFRFDFEDDEDSEEQVFRSELYNVYEALVQTTPRRTLQFVRSAAAALFTADLPTVPFPYVEATLRLIHHYSDGLRGVVAATLVTTDPDFGSLIQQLHSSTIARHYHPEVVLLYFEITLRYHAIFPKVPHLLPGVLDALTGASGLQHGHARVRSRCCYILLRLVKHTISLLRDVAATAIVGICRMVEENPVTLTNDDKLHLFETVGILIGKTKRTFDGPQQRQHLQAIITPHIRHIEHLLSQQQQYEPETFISNASNAIAVIAFLSKGFTRPGVEVQSLFAEILPYSLQVLRAMPQAELIRNKTMVLQQRMILLVGKATIATGRQFLRLLITHCTSDDLLLVAQLMNQYAKFNEDASLVLESEIVPFLQRCDALMRLERSVADDDDGVDDDSGVGCLQHTALEELRVRKLIYTVLQTIVSQKATAVLLSEGNVSHLPSVLETMCNGAILAPDALAQRTCLKFFRDLSTQFTDPTNLIHNDVKRMVLTNVCQTVFPKAIEMLAGLGPKLKDATTARLIPEISELLVILRSQEQLQQLLEQTNAWTSVLHPLLACENSVKTISSLLEAQLKSQTSWQGK